MRHHGGKLVTHVVWDVSQHEQEESDMHATTAAVDLAKNVYQVVLADAEQG